jgi:hypothetical protein
MSELKVQGKEGLADYSRVQKLGQKFTPFHFSSFSLAPFALFPLLCFYSLSLMHAFLPSFFIFFFQARVVLAKSI